ncbi:MULTISPECIES: MlaD family protein [unclassified Nocardia]|uniref:MlaD family protein n=1 Tax=unclassified Nocardia TaxID=2637762 RepID=UPI0036979A15
MTNGGRNLTHLQWRVVPLLCGLVATVATGCSLNPGTLATEVQSAGSGQKLTIQFATILNLTDGADVTVNGVKVGHVDTVKLSSSSADVVVGFDKKISIAPDAHASIRQATVLGDSFVSIQSSGSADTETAHSAGTKLLPLNQTTSPPPLENTLAVLANFVNGGSIRSAQDAMRMINKSFPVLEQTQRVSSIVSVDTRDVAAHTTSVDVMIDAMNATAGAINSRADELGKMLSADGMHYWSQLSLGLQQVGVVLPSVGSVFEGGYWLLPLLHSADGSISTVRDGIDAVGSNEELLQKFLDDNLFPFIRRPDITIVSATSPAGNDILANAETILRMLGAIR